MSFPGFLEVDQGKDFTIDDHVIARGGGGSVHLAWIKTTELKQRSGNDGEQAIIKVISRFRLAAGGGCSVF